MIDSCRYSGHVFLRNAQQIGHHGSLKQGHITEADDTSHCDRIHSFLHNQPLDVRPLSISHSPHV